MCPCHLQIIFEEKTLFQIASLIAECVVLESAVVLPDKSLHAAYITLKELEISIPINGGLIDASDRDGPFTGVRLHIAGFMMAKSPFLNFRTLELEKDPVCYRIWKGNPVDSSHQRYRIWCLCTELRIYCCGPNYCSVLRSNMKPIAGVISGPHFHLASYVGSVLR